ncbi:MAG: hypothetical protein V4736_01830 [Bdellovibrionota bacterium]
MKVMFKQLSLFLAIGALLVFYTACGRFSVQTPTSVTNSMSNSNSNSNPNSNPTSNPAPTPGPLPSPGTPTNWPVLAPGESFNGVPCSGYGGTCLPAIARSTASPAAHWIVPSDRRLVNDGLICVDADAKGGVAYVKFYGEGGTTQVSRPGLIKDTDVNGRARTRYGYCAVLDSAAWKAKTTTGSARIFADACPVDPRMQCRRIGVAATHYNGDYQMVIYPRTQAHDWSKTVCSSGCDFATLKEAIERAALDSAKAPLITFNASGFYEIQSSSRESSGDTFMTITSAPGVTATLGRAAAYSGNPTGENNAWYWTPGWNRIEFRGKGIVFDIRNWTVINTTSPDWFNGVKVTNSVGRAVYWNGGGHPGWGTPPSYWDDVYAEYIFVTFNYQRYAINNQIKGTWGDIFSSTNYLFNNYVRDADASIYRASHPGIAFRFTASGGQTSATVTKTSGDVTGGNLLLKVNGEVTHTIPLGYFSTDTNPTVNAVAAAVNAFAAEGWSATVLTASQGLMRPSSINFQSSFSDQNVFNTNYSPWVGFDVHGDWWQARTDGEVRQNVIIRNNLSRDVVDYSAFIFNDAGAMQDIIVKNNIWLGGTATAPAFSNSPGITKNHYVFNSNTLQSWVSRVKTVAGDITYSEFKNNIVGTAFFSEGSGATCDQDAPWINNIYGEASYCVANNAPGESGNATYNWASFSELFVSASDLSPRSGGAVTNNLRNRADDYDQRFCLRSDVDYVGAWSKNCAASEFPF